jgi:hypothetical protein
MRELWIPDIILVKPDNMEHTIETQEEKFMTRRLSEFQRDSVTARPIPGLGLDKLLKMIKL